MADRRLSLSPRSWSLDRWPGGVNSPAASALALSFLICAVIIALSGENPASAYGEMWTGATTGAGPRTVINRGIPIVAMALAISIPFRTGIISLGGEGQFVLGGFAAAVVAVNLEGSGPLVILVSLLVAAIAGAAWGLLPAVGQTWLQLPILISSLLLNTPARAIASYLTKNYFADPTATTTSTEAVPAATRVPTVGWLSGASASAFGVTALVVLIYIFNRRTAPGYQSHISGINLKFSRYGGVPTSRQTILSMCSGGAIAGMAGAHMILGQSGRFVDGDLVGTGFAWTGLLVALLALHRAVPILAAGLFFAALQVGGLAMQRNTGVSWQLAQVLQAVVILALAMKIAPRLWRKGPHTDTHHTDTAEPVPPSPPTPNDHAPVTA